MMNTIGYIESVQYESPEIEICSTELAANICEASPGGGYEDDTF